MLATITSGAVLGIHGYSVQIEAHLGFGLTLWNMVGLPDGAVRESRVRIQSALTECGFDWPMRPISINLAPADIRKDGTAFDLPIALALLAADRHIPASDSGHTLPGCMALGELGLSGEVRPIKGVLPLCLAARAQNLHSVIVPTANAPEASLVRDLHILPVSHLDDVIAHARHLRPLSPFPHSPLPDTTPTDALNMSDIRGQLHARRALEIAAAGGHNLLMIGPPGSGKTMLARRLPSILPPLSFDEALATTSLYSVAGLLPPSGIITHRPFRSPHHTISDVGLVGGGPHNPRPGELSLSSHGVLFLDELPEFRRAALEALRQPLEDQRITITRSLTSVDYPAQAMLVAAMNGCPCGYTGSRRRACSCSPSSTQRYLSRLSGPLLDRIDIHLQLSDLSCDELLQQHTLSEPSSSIRARVCAAHAIQRDRSPSALSPFNARIPPGDLHRLCPVDPPARLLLLRAIDRLGLSARAHDRIIRLARTIADLCASPTLTSEHIAEAISYRSLDRSVAPQIPSARSSPPPP
jgi:magnesium chelatase family protein